MSNADEPGNATLGVPGGEGPGVRIGAFTIIRQLGEGGFGVVYEAEQEQPLRRRVALKVIKLGMDTREVIARFEAERQALALMDHPHIARVFDAGATETGRPYFVMELVKGEPISNFCINHELPVEQRLELFEQVCAAAQHAHAKGIIHRDLKPNNVLVSEHDGQPFAQIIDFGIAKATSGRLTDKTLQTEQFLMMGTPLYMSPEQAAGDTDIDSRTDIYALGVILYELLTDSTPIESHSLRSAAYGEVQRIIRDVDPPVPSARLLQSARISVSEGGRRSMDPRKLAGIVRGELDWIVMKAIEKDRNRRYETASDLATDLRLYRSGRPVLAAPPGIGYRLRKALRRNRSVLAVGALLVVAVLVTLIGVDRWSVFHATSPAAAAASAVPGKSIAVLPFENLSSDKDNAYFADGMQDMILTKLADIRELKVISRTSTAKYASHPDNLRTISTELGVATVLEGSVQKAGNQVLINVQLIDARSDQHLWAQAYKRTLDNVFDVEGEVAQAVADALDAKLSAAEQNAVKVKPTSNPAAYDAYLRGLALLPSAQYNVHKRVAACEQAVRLDPGFALAWSWLSRDDAWMYFNGEDHSEDRRLKAREAMETVERLAPGSSESLLAHGYYAYRVDRDFEGARQFFERARAASPNDVEPLWPLAMIARRQGRWQESIDLLERAMAVDPRNLLTLESADTTYASMRDFRHAQRIMDRELALAPGPEGLLGSQAALFMQGGDLASLKKLLDQWPAGHAKADNNWFPEGYFLYARDFNEGIAFLKAELTGAQDQDTRTNTLAVLGDMYRLTGDATSARSIYLQASALLEKSLKAATEDTQTLRTLAMVQAGLGEKGLAIATAKQAIAIDTRFGDRSETPKDEEIVARIQARFGDKDAAIDTLHRLIQVAYFDPVSVATLQLDPD